MFFVMRVADSASYADDDTTYVAADSIEDFIKNLENGFRQVIQMVLWWPDEGK